MDEFQSDELPSLLSELVGHYESAGLDVARHLVDSQLSREEVAVKIQDLTGFAPTEDIVTLYTTFDGSAPVVYNLSPGNFVLSLRGACAAVESAQRAHAEDDWYPPVSWFPVFDGDGGVTVVMLDGPDRGKLRVVYDGELQMIRVQKGHEAGAGEVTLTSWIAALNKAFTEGLLGAGKDAQGRALTNAIYSTRVEMGGGDLEHIVYPWVDPTGSTRSL